MSRVFAAALAAGLFAAPTFTAPTFTAPAFTAQAFAAETISLHASTARELAELCGARPGEPAADAKINYCHGFAQGAVDVERKRAEQSKLFCFPPNPPNRGVVMGEFVNWVRAVPDHANQSALAGLFHFFGERFPCK